MKIEIFLILEIILHDQLFHSFISYFFFIFIESSSTYFKVIES